MRGIITHSGRFVSLDETPITVPSLSDIGCALGRMPRFAGHTRRFWTVAHHVLWLHDYVKHVVSKPSRDLELGILLHDAHEALTGDIPTAFKSFDMRKIQAEFDEAIFARYSVNFKTVRKDVEHFDHMALLTEAAVVGPSALDPATPEGEQLLRETFGGSAPDAAVEFLRRWLDDDIARPARPDLWDSDMLARIFVDRVINAL